MSVSHSKVNDDNDRPPAHDRDRSTIFAAINEVQREGFDLMLLFRHSEPKPSDRLVIVSVMDEPVLPYLHNLLKEAFTYQE